MKELVKIIAEALVDNKDAIEVTQTVDENDAVLVTLRVAPEDMGKIIGKQGRIAKALRTVVKAAAIRADRKVVVEIAQ